MPKKQRKNKNTKVREDQFVTVVFARDIEEAMDYKTILQANDISANIKEVDEQTEGVNEIAVMVPEEFLDEAHVIIESQNAYDDFYDLASEEENEMDFDSPFLDDDL